MATPVNDTYAAATGVKMYAGRTPTPPLWAVGAPLNAWIPIPGTGNNTLNAPIEQYSGWVRVGTRLIVPLAGGHDYSDNRVSAVELALNSPVWGDICPPSPVMPAQSAGLAYYADGKPCSRHTRFNAQYMPTLNRVMMLGARDIFGIGPPSKSTVDGFDYTPGVNAWDPAGTYPDVPDGTPTSAPHVTGGACVDDNGDGWIDSGTVKFTAATRTWSKPLTVTAPKGVRYPWANAAGKGYMFGLCLGDGWGFSLAQGVCAIKQVGNVQTQITFNDSPALQQFIADVPIEAGMDYDRENDFFLFYAGAISGRIYKIKPNNGTVWDMELWAYGSGNTSPPSQNGGMQNRLTYMPEFRGFVTLTTRAAGIHYMRTA